MWRSNKGAVGGGFVERWQRLRLTFWRFASRVTLRGRRRWSWLRLSWLLRPRRKQPEKPDSCFTLATNQLHPYHRPMQTPLMVFHSSHEFGLTPPSPTVFPIRSKLPAVSETPKQSNQRTGGLPLGRRLILLALRLLPSLRLLFGALTTCVVFVSASHAQFYQPAQATKIKQAFRDSSYQLLSADTTGALRVRCDSNCVTSTTSGRLDSVRRIDSVRVVANQLAGRLDSLRRVDTVRYVVAVGEIRAAPLHVTGTAAVNTALTITLPAVAGQFHYITSIQWHKLYSVIGVAAGAGVICTSTNLPGNPAWTTEQLASAAGTVVQVINYQATTPLKSSVANTATTIVCPLQLQTIWRGNVSYFTAP